MTWGCEHLTKRYGTQTVLEDLNVTFAPGGVYSIMAPSGGGKTTLFRLFAGLEAPDGGRVLGFQGCRISMVFQEDRLFEHLSPVTNAALVQQRPDWGAITHALEEILPRDCLTQPVRELSGGMKRRVAIARAVLCPSEVLLLDEPFTGLDEETRMRTIQFVRERRGDRLLLLTTHRLEEAELLGAEIIRL
ncbi:MAG: ATP-binding cassette domain-containing protein [Candidatus Onthomonas sp.]